ncbi:nitrate- and nitrite sensing domain-containing protein [Streptomyces griseorubiginosus]|uniref:nitrate- and nitrite sensing domain-containing protein n=1 Tax=Streptomyces griseorubiginosus TaxID=67304 RepID=UPI0036EF9337
MPDRKGARRRLGSIRLSLILLALVPSVTLTAMWGVTTTQLFSEGLRLRSQTELSRSTGAMGTEATLALQGERAASAAWLAGVPGSRSVLDQKRADSDKAVAKLVGRSDEIQRAPGRIADQLYSVLGSVGSLEYYRGQVDHPTDITAVQALDQYTSIIDDQVHAFQQLSQVDDGDLTSQAGPLVALEHAAELTSQEDVQLTLAWPSGHLAEKDWEQFVQLVNTRRWLVEDQIVPALSGSAKTQTERILASPDWQTLMSVEDQVLAARSDGTGRVALPDARKRWAAAMERVSVRYSALIRQQTSGLLTRSADKAHEQLLTAASLSAGGLVALLICLVMSWRITRSLSRRLRGLRVATLGLAQELLPDVVARLERGEKVDVDKAAPELDYGSDELGQVAKAFNTAQRTAVVTAVELADTRRGFQKVILGIARQSQNLVNLQLSRLDTLEREHQDPDVLAGLYELDSTASQLRRYEENLVIISGGRPGRSWSEPVALIDILRSAVGEVAEYQRVEVHTEEEVCLAPPAVADVIHLLAELIENATLYSPAPSPVGVRAGLVAKGLAVEVEDRGLGMSEEEYAAFNAHLAEAPKFDVVALADDLRLGMFVVARLANRHGIQVTLRSSPYGGTTAIVLIPHEVVVRDEAGAFGDAGALSDVPPEAAGVTAAVAGGSARTALTAGPVRRTRSADRPGRPRDAGEADDTGGAPDGDDTDHSAGADDTGGAAEANGTDRSTGTGDPDRAADADGRGHTADANEWDRSAHAGGRRHTADANESDRSAHADGRGHTADANESDRSAHAEGHGRAADADGAGRSGGGASRAPGLAEVGSGAGAGGPVDAGPAGTDGTAGARGARGAAGSAASDLGLPPSPRLDGLAPLPRRVPQTSLAVELRDDPSVSGVDEGAEEFTADHAASSLAGFQRGTLRARDEDDLLDDPWEPEGPESPQDPATDSAAPDIPKEATAYGIDPLDTPGDRAAESSDAVGDAGSPEAPDGPLDAPQDPAVAARTPHTDRS